MSTFSLPGARLATYFSDEHGHPVVQLHGLTSSRERDRLLDLDLGRGLSGTRLLRYDARGHGQSTGGMDPEDYTWPQLATDLLALLDAFFPGEQVHGVGPSMGCATLLHAAVRDPGRFSGLTLMLPPTAWETRTAQAAVYEARARFIEEQGMERFLQADAMAAPPPATVGRPATVPDISAELLVPAYRGAARSNLPTREDLATLTMPVTILCWTDDPGHPVSTAIDLATIFPMARLYIATAPQEVARWPEVLAEDVVRDTNMVAPPHL